MAKNIYVGVSNKAHKVKAIYVGVGGIARKVKKGYIGVGGVARLFWSGGTVPFSYAGECQNELPSDYYIRHLSLDNYIIYTGAGSGLSTNDTFTGAFDKNFVWHSIRTKGSSSVDTDSPQAIVGNRALFPEAKSSYTSSTVYTYDNNLISSTFSMPAHQEGYAASIANGSVGYFSFGYPDRAFCEYVTPVDSNLVVGSNIYPTTVTRARGDNMRACGTEKYVMFAGETLFTTTYHDKFFLVIDANRVIVNDAENFIDGKCYSMETIDFRNVYGYTSGSWNVGGAYKISENLVVTQLTWGGESTAPDDLWLRNAFGATNSHIFAYDTDNYGQNCRIVAIDENLIDEHYIYKKNVSQSDDVNNWMVSTWRAQDKAMQIYSVVTEDSPDYDHNSAIFNIYNG